MNERTIIITEWIEPRCPYCRYVYYSILQDLQVRRYELNYKLMRQGYQPMPPIEIKLIDVSANDDSKEMQWFQQYSEKIGGIFTPAIKVGESGKIHYLWGKEKKSTLEKSQLSSTEELRMNILREIQDILTRVEQKMPLYDKELFNPMKNIKTQLPLMYQPHGGF